MPRYEFQRPARAALLDQLIAAGVPPDTLVELGDAQCWVTCAPEQFAAVAAVVAAHDAAALDAAAAAEATQDQDAGDRLRAAVASLREDEARLADTTVLSTLALLRPVVLRLVRVQLWQLRLLMRRGAV